MNLNPLVFQYGLRGTRLADLHGQMLAIAFEDRDRQLEDYLGTIGATGPTGPVGPAGPAGPAGPT